jgi:hypothetical protein
MRFVATRLAGAPARAHPVSIMIDWERSGPLVTLDAGCGGEFAFASRKRFASQGYDFES